MVSNVLPTSFRTDAGVMAMFEAPEVIPVFEFVVGVDRFARGPLYWELCAT